MLQQKTDTQKPNTHASQGSNLNKPKPTEQKIEKVAPLHITFTTNTYEILPKIKGPMAPAATSAR